MIVFEPVPYPPVDPLKQGAGHSWFQIPDPPRPPVPSQTTFTRDILLALPNDLTFTRAYVLPALPDT
jgi:hypothetical protein